MPAISSSAPGKIILCGEHVVVYGFPAIALPVFAVATRTRIYAHPTGISNEVILNAPAIALNAPLNSLSADHPLRRTVELTMQELGINTLPACEIQITSTILLGAGLGSSASTSVSVARAVSAFVGHPLAIADVNHIAFEVEKIHHGTPSGIDNTVITYEEPIYFQREKEIELINVSVPFQLVIADSGISISTAEAVAGVRQRWQTNPSDYNTYFERIADYTREVKHLLESGEPEKTGPLLTQNHQVLANMGVSSPRLDGLVETALQAGALGAKLSGGGIGGNIIALVEPATADKVIHALEDNGAVRTILITTPPVKGF